jgi:2-aminoadipate transaminase
MTDHDQFLSRAGRGLRESAIRQMGSVLAQGRDMVSFAPGYPAEDLFPWEEFSAIAHDLLTGADGPVLQYGPTRGYPPFLDALVELMATRGVATEPQRLLVTTGSQQGLDLVARVLLDPGDVALVELPSYTGAISAFRNNGAELVGIRQHADGIDLDHLQHTLVRLRGEGRRVKFLYVVPNFQNPTGCLLGLDKRRQLLEWASQRDLLILEDDPYRDLYFPDVTAEDDTRPIAVDDTDGRVIYLSSFSKTLAPAFRVGWIHGPAAIVTKLELAKQSADLCSGGFDQRVAYEACRSGLLARHIPTLRTHYQAKRDVMVTALERDLADQMTWVAPRGGFFLWVRLAHPLTAGALLAAARARGVIYVTGDAFYVDGSGDREVRLSFSAPSHARIEEGVRRLRAAVGDVLDRHGRAVVGPATLG